MRALKEEAKALNLQLKPKTITVDFEQAAIHSFSRNFLSAQLKGCLFHFGQSLFKKLAKCCLKQVYLANKDLQVWFKSVFTLALLP